MKIKPQTRRCDACVLQNKRNVFVSQHYCNIDKYNTTYCRLFAQLIASSAKIPPSSAIPYTFVQRAVLPALHCNRLFDNSVG